GFSPHTSSISASTLTKWFARTSRVANTWRIFGAVGVRANLPSVTSRVPSILNSIRSPSSDGADVRNAAGGGACPAVVPAEQPQRHQAALRLRQVTGQSARPVGPVGGRPSGADDQVGELRPGVHIDPAGVLQVAQPDLADLVLDAAAGLRPGGDAGQAEHCAMQPVRDVLLRHWLVTPGGRGWRPTGPRNSRNGRRVGTHRLPGRRLPGGSRVRSTASLPAPTRV